MEAAPDSDGKPPRNSTRPTSRKGRTPHRPAPTAMQKCWDEYCKSTGLHGIKYFSGDHRSTPEKMFWLMVMILCMALSVQQIYAVYDRWVASPPILSAAATAPSWEVPFPAVSICPKNKTSMFGFDVCNTTEGMASPDCIETILQAMPSLNDVVKSCSWNDIPLKVDDHIFTRTLSDEGICYTFNMIDTSDIFTDKPVYYGGGQVNDTYQKWTLEDGYPMDAFWNVFPRRAVGNRIRASGLSLVVQSEDRFKIVLHTPIDLPIVSLVADVDTLKIETNSIESPRQYTFFPISEAESVVDVSPTLSVSSKDLLGVDSHRRLCYFPSERPLHFFKTYTQRNCELECIANHTVKACNCAPIYMPRYANETVCRDRDCYANATKDEMEPECDCLPTCTSVGYEFAISHFSWEREYNVETVDEELENWLNMSRITIQVKDTTITAIGKTESYSRFEFLADCGGLLGLFSGFSIITAVEIFFHLIIKWCCYLSDGK